LQPEFGCVLRWREDWAVSWAPVWLSDSCLRSREGREEGSESLAGCPLGLTVKAEHTAEKVKEKECARERG